MIFHLVVEEEQYTERSQARSGQWMKSLEEENELQVLGDLLEVWAKWRDGYKLGDVEDKGEAQHRHHVAENCLLQVRGSLLG